MAAAVEDAHINEQGLENDVENLRVSDEQPQQAQRNGGGRGEGGNRNDTREKPRESNRGGRGRGGREKAPPPSEEGNKDVLQEPKIRHEHDTRYNYSDRRGGGRDGPRRGERGGERGDGYRDREGRDGGRDRDGRGADRDNWGEGRGRRDDDRQRGVGGFSRGRPREGREDRPPQERKPLTESEKAFQEQQKARAEQRRIKMQVMLERNKEYLAKQGEGGEKEKEKEKEIPPEAEEKKEYPEDEDEEGKDEGDVWGHDGWDKMMHDSNPNRRRCNKQNPEPSQSSRREEANRYVPPRLRSVPRQEQWLKEREEKTQARALEQEQKDAEQEAKNKEREQRKKFIQPLYVPPNRKAAQAQKEQAQVQEPTTPTKEEEISLPSEEDVKAPVEKASPQQAPEKTPEKEKEKEKEEVEEGEEEEGEEEEEYEEDEEEGEEDEDEEEGEEEEEEDVLLILRLEISRGVTKSLKVCKGDNPEEVAAKFCKTHGMSDAKLRVIINTIETNLKQNTSP